MKRFSLLLIVFLLFLMAGCGNDDLVAAPESSNASKPVVNPDGFVFEYNGLDIAMSAEAKPILEALGDHMEYFESESCAFVGLDKIYTYSGFELHTYPVDGVDYVAAIAFLDDSIATKEGIRLNSDVEEVIAAYGDKYSEDLGVYTYEKGDSRLSFLTKENKVLSIEYNVIVDHE